MLANELEGTPLEGQARHYIEAGTQYDVDPLFLVAISFHESRYCDAYAPATNAERHNCAGIMSFSNGNRSIKRYDSYQAFIFDHARIIREVYLDRGKETIKDVWLTYAPLNENPNSSWGGGVMKKYNELKANMS